MNVNWTESALADLRSIELSISRHSVRYAKRMIERIFSRIGDLRDHPFLGPMVVEYEDESLRELFEDPYRIIYRVIEDVGQVDILAVIHAARRLPRGI